MPAAGQERGREHHAERVHPRAQKQPLGRRQARWRPAPPGFSRGDFPAAVRQGGAGSPHRRGRGRRGAGLPPEIRQEDGTRDTYQLAFGDMDYDHSKTIEFVELAAKYGYSNDGASAILRAAPPPPTIDPPPLFSEISLAGDSTVLHTKWSIGRVGARPRRCACPPPLAPPFFPGISLAFPSRISLANFPRV